MHSPYFGPGYIASMHVLAAHTGETAPLERLFGKLEATLYPGLVDPDAEGMFAVPKGPGLGMTPDADVLRDYAVKD